MKLNWPHSYHRAGSSFQLLWSAKQGESSELLSSPCQSREGLKQGRRGRQELTEWNPSLLVKGKPPAASTRHHSTVVSVRGKTDTTWNKQTKHHPIPLEDVRNEVTHPWLSQAASCSQNELNPPSQAGYLCTKGRWETNGNSNTN